ncbi:GDSL-type esterase/lipase family protein [Pseudoxanthomonas koreensis]|uniref:SGNH/GDSL hydrolase family protein n=1 Tax=Pseudoxanthomonas koreensis TaxID=266061 RepID=UPI0035A740EC
MKSWGLLVLACLAATPATAQTVSRVDPADVAGFDRVLPMRIVGRVAPEQGDTPGLVRRQWPGTYFETAFDGTEAAFRVGPGEVHLRVGVDGTAIPLLRPAPGLYRVAGLAPGPHRLRVDVVSESQAGATVFGGFHARAGTTPIAPTPRPRQIEFIGDSHTVGYGNTSATRNCTREEVWRTTDTSQGIAPRVARHFDADYQVNAISGRGIVRNYDGGPGHTLPQAYPYTLFEDAQPYLAQAWSPQVIVIALGTNDFTTPLRPGEHWPTRQALHRDFQAGYAGFVRELRARNPAAEVVLWATDLADGEIAAQVEQVVQALHAAGEQRVQFVRIGGLQMSACDWHPGLADDQAIAAAIIAELERRPDTWSQTPPGSDAAAASLPGN